MKRRDTAAFRRESAPSASREVMRPIAAGDLVRLRYTGGHEEWASVIEVLSTGALVVESVRWGASRIIARGKLSRTVQLGYALTVTSWEPWRVSAKGARS